MNEIEKMYENAGLLYCNKCRHDSELDCLYMCENKYSPFIAEKQIELIKWLLQNKRLCIQKAEYSNNFYMDTLSNRLNGVDNKDFEQCLVSLVNNIWQSLTKEECKQVKEILE